MPNLVFGVATLVTSGLLIVLGVMTGRERIDFDADGSQEQQQEDRKQRLIGAGVLCGLIAVGFTVSGIVSLQSG